MIQKPENTFINNEYIKKFSRLADLLRLYRLDH